MATSIDFKECDKYFIIAFLDIKANCIVIVQTVLISDERCQSMMESMFPYLRPWKGVPSIPYPFNYFEIYPISLK